MNSWMAAVLNSVWQAFAIAACLWAILKFARRLNAATRHAVWWAALVIVILLPGASIVIEKKQATTNPFAPAARIGAAGANGFVVACFFSMTIEAPGKRITITRAAHQTACRVAALSRRANFKMAHRHPALRN